MSYTFSLPTSDQARSLAIMMKSGAPSQEAIQYFLAEVDPDHDWSPTSVAALHEKWMKSKAVASAVVELQGKEWADMTLDEQISLGLDKNYAEMAYFLYTRNYAAAGGVDKLKMDTCRSTLETKKAGLAGKLDPLTRFWEDMRTAAGPGHKNGPAEIKKFTPLVKGGLE